MKKQIALILLVTFLAGCAKTNQDELEQGGLSALPVRVKSVESSPYVEMGEYYGKIQGIEEVTLISFLGGKVESIEAVEGQKVSQGDSLGKIGAEKAMTSYKLALLNEKVARETYYRQQEFLKAGNVSQLAADQAELAWLSAKNALIDAERGKEAAFCESPIEGTVVARYIELHQETSAGTPSFSIADLSRIRLTLEVPEQEINGLKAGNKAYISLDTYPGEEWTGEVVRVSKKVSDQTLSFTCVVEADNPGEELLSGTTALVTVERTSFSQTIEIPQDSLLEDTQGPYVLVAQEGKAKKVSVQVRAYKGDRVILTEGPQLGSLLITEGAHLVTEGQDVRIVDEG